MTSEPGESPSPGFVTHERVGDRWIPAFGSIRALEFIERLCQEEDS